MENRNVDPITLMESQEKLTNVNDNLSAIRLIIEGAINEAKTTGGGMISGLDELRKDVGQSLAGIANVGKAAMPFTYSDPDIATRPHHGMFLHQQGLFSSIRASTGMGSTPEGIDPYSYRVMSREALGRKMEAIGVGVGGGLGETTASLAIGYGAYKLGALAGAKAGAAIGTAFAPGIGTFVGAGVGIGVGLAADFAMEAVGPVARWTERRELENVMRRGSWRIAGTTWGRGELGGLGENQLEEVSRSLQGISDDIGFGGSGKVKTVLEHGMARGLYDDVRSIQEISDRTRVLVRDVKAVSNRAHVPIESALAVMGDLKNMGFTGNPAEAMSQFDRLGMVAGRTSMEMMGFAQSLGARTQTQAMGAAGLLADVRGYQMSGTYDPELVRRLGGAETVAANQFSSAQGFISSPMFRGMGMAMMGTGPMSGIGSNQIGNVLSMSPQQIMQQAYSSEGGGFGGFVNKVLSFQRNQEQLVDQLGFEGVQKMQETSMLKQAQYAVKIMPGIFGSTAAKEDLLYDIARKQNMGHEEAEMFVSKMKNYDSIVSGHERARTIEAKKAADEEGAKYGLVATAGRGITQFMGSMYNRFDRATDVRPTGIGQAFGRLGRWIHNLPLPDEYKKYETDLTAEDVTEENLSIHDSYMGGEDRKRRTTALGRLSDLAEGMGDKISGADLKAMERDTVTQKKLRGGKSESEARLAVMKSTLNGENIDLTSLASQFGWKGDPESWSKEQRAFMANMISDVIGDEPNARQAKKLEVVNEKLGVLVKTDKISELNSDIENITREINKDSWLGRGALSKFKTAAKGLAEEVDIEKFHSIIKGDERGEFALAAGVLMDPNADEKAKNIAKSKIEKRLSEEKMSSSEAEKVFSVIGSYDAGSDYVKAAKTLTGKRQELLTKTLAKGVYETKITQSQLDHASSEMAAGRFGAAEKLYSGLTNVGGESSIAEDRRRMGMTEQEKTNQRIAEDLANTVKMLFEEVKEFRGQKKQNTWP